MSKFNFGKLSGVGVKIAVIDTGLEVTHPYFKSASGISCISIEKIDSNWGIATVIDDPVGHGTACAGIIHKKAPNAHITGIKVLDSDTSGRGPAILDALEWCIDSLYDVVNISLGSFSEKYINEFERLSSYAHEKGVILVAASSADGYESIPARLPGYIGVGPARVIGPYDYYKKDGHIEYLCNATRQRLAWKDGKQIFLDGSSFSAAHMSGIIALIKEAYPQIRLEELHKLLEENALPYVQSNQPVQEPSNFIFNSPKYKITKAAIYPFNKEMHSILRFSDLCNFEINAIADIPQKGLIGKSAYNLLGVESEQDLVITKDLDAALSTVDTLIISRTDLVSTLLKRDYQYHAMKKAIEHSVNIFSLDYSDHTLFPDLYKIAAEKSIKIRHPMVGYADLQHAVEYRDTFGHIGNSTPIIGVFGTGTSQGKFTVQLTLRRELKKRGYNVANVGTEIHAELFGFESHYPIEIEKSVVFDKADTIPFLQGEIRRLELSSPKYDLIIAGCQSGIIPYSFAYSPRTYTIPSIAFLFGCLPHAYILTINITDDPDFVRNSIHALELLGKGKVILLVVSTKLKQSKTNKERILSSEEICTIIDKLEQQYGLPVTEVISPMGCDKMLYTLINYFS